MDVEYHGSEISRTTEFLSLAGPALEVAPTLPPYALGQSGDGERARPEGPRDAVKNLLNRLHP
ncbi:hypothetical protein ACFZAG_19905 [Streptomyces sp. NPDC012403]|jgi:hypothetical protein|uniref:hypothetical protein n=1 Tax=Streptomyces sp. NPDC012403 TaxID=3364831 RepID=UPI0036EB6151